MNKSIWLVCLFAAGCATTDLKEVSQAWYGAPYDEVAAAWGKPGASSKNDEGVEMHVWRTEGPPRQSSSMSIGFGSVRSSGNVAIGTGTGISVPVGPPPAPLVCERRMFFRDGQVIDWDWSGDPSYCATFKRRQ